MENEATPKAFRVTLTHKVKFELEAGSPEEAIQKAKVRVADFVFEPQTFAVKELEVE